MDIAYEILGRGERTVVYLHGLLLDSGVNRGLATELAGAGYRVVLLDLPGHGRSAKPATPAAHRIEAYSATVLGLLEVLEIDRAVLGGMSLGANVALEAASLVPERVAGLLLEMPVLVFAPVLLLASYASPLLSAVLRMGRLVPRDRLGTLGSVLGAFSLEPQGIAAVPKGVMTGSVVPQVTQRTSIRSPALVIGHRSGRLHPLDDAVKLSRQLPRARMVEARSILELRVAPERLMSEILAFLEEAFCQLAELAG
ncbi:MAG: alpha/beta fold hydrolase [Acidimicrobiales bacterium]